MSARYSESILLDRAVHLLVFQFFTDSAVLDNWPVSRKKLFLRFVCRCFRFLRDDNALILALNDSVAKFPKESDQPVQRFEPCSLVIESDIQDRVLAVYRGKINNDFDFVADVVHPYVRK